MGVAGQDPFSPELLLSWESNFRVVQQRPLAPQGRLAEPSLQSSGSDLSPSLPKAPFSLLQICLAGATGHSASSCGFTNAPFKGQPDSGQKAGSDSIGWTSKFILFRLQQSKHFLLSCYTGRPWYKWDKKGAVDMPHLPSQDLAFRILPL